MSMKYIITAIAGFVLAATFSVVTAEAACGVTSFTANQTSVSYGGSTTVSWNSVGCTTVSITPAQYPDGRPPAGSTNTGALIQTTTFTATGYDQYGFAGGSRTLTITVTGTSGGGSGNCHPTSFTAQEYTVQSGNGTVLHWDSQGCASAAIHPAAYPGDRPPYGSIATGAIMYATEFTLTVYDAQGNIGGQRFLTVNVNGSSGSNDCEIDEFDADDTSIDDGDSTELTWRTTRCDYVTLTSVSGHLNTDGSRDVSPSSTTTYTLRAYDNNGNLGDTDTVTIHVDDNDEECSIDSFSASPSSIDRGDDSTLRWNTSGDVDYVTISGLSGNRSDDGSVSVSPYSTTTYTLRAHCNNGDTETDTVTVRMNNTQVSSQPQAITTVATILGGTQARLNGIAVPNTNNSTTRAWFEWGTGAGFGNRTNSQTVLSGFASQYYSDVISGLVPGGTYYYRAVVQNSDGTAYGDTVRFQTQRTVVTTTPPVIVRSTTNTVVAKSAPSLLELRVESNYDRMCVNGSMEYTISYRNISNQTLDNAVLRFTHPKEITYLNASRGNYEVVDRTMTIDLGDIRPNESGTIIVHARVNDSAIRGNLTVATTSVVYTNTVSRAQEDAIAYALITVSEDCPNILGASAAGLGSFLPTTLLGWLLLILVILALIVLGRQFYKKTERPQ